MSRSKDNDSPLVRLAPHSYVHILNRNDNITRTVIGPVTLVRQEHESIVHGPVPMITIPPRHCCVIANPVVRDEKGAVVLDSHGQAVVRVGDQEIRMHKPKANMFALYPGEELVGEVEPLIVVPPDTALRLQAIRDVVVDYTAMQATAVAGKSAPKGKASVPAQVEGKRSFAAGDEWLFVGPGTYPPLVEVRVVERIEATIIKPNQALRLRGRRAFTDRTGTARRAGEEWLVRSEGAYLPDVDEEFMNLADAIVLTEKKALALRAHRAFTDVMGKERKAGQEWLVTLADADTHIPDVHETVIGTVALTTLSARQYCVVLDPVDKSSGKQRLGHRELRKGEQTFFLLPGEKLENGIQPVHVLGEDEAMLLRAREAFSDVSSDKSPISRKPGDRWMIHGPCDYVPPTTVEIVEKRQSIALDENEGIYVRDMNTGKVRSVVGKTYMLKPFEELWEKDLPPEVESLLQKDISGIRGTTEEGAKGRAGGKRDRTRVVSFRAPHNSAVQIYDFKLKKSRVVFGPEMILLEPEESFTVLSLSGGKPKRPHVIKSLALLLGPDFMTDIITVETSDHARLHLQISYNWHFDTTKATEDGMGAAKLFQVPDFVGDACKAVASRVRGAVAQVPFDNFHKHSAKVIRMSVFGSDEKGKVRDSLVFPQNNLVITNVDIQSVEPVDARTRDSLQKSVQLAIEITTKSQEAAARHEAERVEQMAKGTLERQRIQDQASAEDERRKLLELRAKSSAVESTGQAKAEAMARAEASRIEGDANLQQAELRAKAMTIETNAELAQVKARNEAELEHQRALSTLEIERAEKLAQIESSKFSSVVNAIGPDTIKSIAQAGPEMQAKLLSGLGLQGYLVTDGKTPLNLSTLAQGMIGTGGLPGASAPQPE